MLKKKVSQAASAVVTGAGSGIGRAFALEIARRGGKVICSDIHPATAEDTAAQIRAGGGKAWGLACDVRQLAQVQALAQQAQAQLGQPADLVINNAGIGAGGRRIGDVSPEDWRATIDVNLWGVIHGCHVFVPGLRELGYGGVLNVASAAGFAAAPMMGPYNVTKAAVLALTETLAAELSNSRLRVSALCPTFVKTNIIRDGRIAAASSRLGATMMAWTGVSAEGVARTALDGLDRGQLYVLPQLDARMAWRMKRYAPASYTRGSALVGRLLEFAQKA